jgi:hypothetical protein
MIAVVFLLWLNVVLAEEMVAPDADAFDTGFILNDDAAPDIDFTQSTTKKSLPLRLKLSLDLARQVATPQRWVRAGVGGQLILDWQTEAGYIYGEATTLYNNAYNIENDPQSIIDSNTLDTQLRELYWQKAFNNLSLSIGRKMVVWGKADLLPVADPITPVDRSAALFAKPEEIRLGQDLIELDYYLDNSQLNFVLIPQARFNRQVDSGHPYDIGSGLSTDNDQDNNLEYGMRWNFNLNRAEAAFIAGKFSNRDPLFNGAEEDYIVAPVIALTYNRAIDPALIKMEFAYMPDQPGQEFNYIGAIPVPYIAKRDRYRIMAGMDYMTQNYGSWIAEGYVEYPLYDEGGSESGNQTGLMALMWSDSYLRDDLALSAVFMTYKKFANRLLRFGASYQIDDNWKLITQYSSLVADDNDPTFAPMEDFDRLDLNLEYSFSL